MPGVRGVDEDTVLTFALYVTVESKGVVAVKEEPGTIVFPPESAVTLETGLMNASIDEELAFEPVGFVSETDEREKVVLLPLVLIGARVVLLPPR